MLPGGIVSFTVSTFEDSIPFQFCVRGAEFGTKVVVVDAAPKVIRIAAALVALLAW